MPEHGSLHKKQKTDKSIISICVLPLDTLIEITQHLDILSIARLSCTCTYFKKIQENKSIQTRIDRYSYFIKERNWSLGVDESTKKGDENDAVFFAKKLIENTPMKSLECEINWVLKYGLCNAARNGHTGIVKLLISLGANGYNDALMKAAKGGHKEIIHFLIQKGANYWNHAMCRAARYGYKDLIDFFIEKGADSWSTGMKYAAKGGHKDIVDFFIMKGANNWDLAMGGAIRGGHKELVEFFIEKGARDLDSGMTIAIHEGHKEIVEIFLKKGCVCPRTFKREFLILMGEN
jgi:ankyrin repeat protein